MTETDDLAPQYIAEVDDRLTQEAYDEDFGDAPAPTAAAPATVPPEGPSGTVGRGQVSENLSDEQLKLRKTRGTDFIDDPNFAESWTMQAVGGLIDGVNAMTDLAKMGSDWLDENVVDLSVGDVEPGAEGNPLRMEEIPKADHTGKSIVRGIAQFLVGFGVAGKALKFIVPATKVGQAGKAMVQGAIADFGAFDGHEERLSNFLMEHTELRNPILEYLAADPGDSELEGRLKNGLEGSLIGLGVDVGAPIVKGFVNSIATLRKARLTRKAAEVAGRLNPDGSVSLDNSGIERDMNDAMSDLDGVSQEGRKRPLFRPASERLQSQVIDRLDAMPVDLGDGRALNINLSRIQGPDEIKAIIDEVAKNTKFATENARRGTIPLEQTEGMAQQLGMTVEELLERQKGTAFNAEQAVASRNIMAASSELVFELAKRANDPAAGQLDKYRFRMALGQHRAIQHQVAGMTAEAGRALSSFRIEAVAGEDRLKAIRQYVNQNGDDIDGMAAAIAGLTDPSQVGAAARGMDKRSAARRGLDAYLEVWVNGILSGPPTQAVNLLSNAMFTTWQIPERALAARLRGQGVQKGEAYELMYGAVSGFKDSIIAMGKAGWDPDLLTNSKFDFARKESINAESFGMNPKSVAGKGVDLIGKGVRLPGRFLQAGDAFFKTLNYRMELRAQAFRAATTEGLEGEAMAQRMAQFMADPPDDMMQAAINFADTNTFTKRAREGSAASYLTRKINDDAPLGRLILPFVQTPANLMSETFQRTPVVNLAVKTWREDWAAGGARRQLAEAKVAAGSMLAATIADLVSNGFITGQGPADPEGKATWRRNGVQPNSIRVGDQYYAYSRLDPLGFMIGMTADIADAAGTMTTKDVEAAAMMAGLGWAQNITSKTYLQGISDLLGALQSQNGAEFQRYIARQGASMSLPYSSLLRTIRRADDPMMRDTAPSGEGMGALGKVWQQYQNEVINMLPQYSKDLPPYMNLWGEPIYYQGGLGPDIASPIFGSKKTNSAIDREIFRLNFDPEKPQKQITHEGVSVELNPHEHAFYIKTAGQMALPILERQVRSPTYTSLTDPQRINMINGVLARTREAARAMTLAEFPELRTIIGRKQLLLMQSGRPQVPDMPPRSPYTPD